MTDTPDDLPSPVEYLRKMPTGEHWSYQRCGRYAYQRVLVHTANPDHLVHGPIVPVASRIRCKSACGGSGFGE